MLWAYFAFSQLLIIWSGNQPEEITFYRSRLNGQWGVVAVIVLLFSFAIPFLLLLSRDVKRTASVVSKIAVWMIFMRLVDLYWMTRPEFTSRAVADVAGHCGSGRADRLVAGIFCHEPEAAAVAAGGRSKSFGGACAA